MAKYVQLDWAIIMVDKIVAFRFNTPESTLRIDTVTKTYEVNYTGDRDKIKKEILDALEDDSKTIIKIYNTTKIEGDNHA